MGDKPDDTFLNEEEILLWDFLDVIKYFVIRIAGMRMILLYSDEVNEI